MRDNKKDQLQGTLDLLVLRTLATGGTMHGYAITERVQQVSREVLRIEAWLALPRPAPDGGIRLGAIGVGRLRQQSPRAVLHITAAGRKRLSEEEEHWTRLAGAVTRVLKQA